MTGVQFVISKYEPEHNLFWIQKRYRISANKYDVVSVYYVLNFVIFQAPTLSHIVDTRINNSIFFQKKAFEVIQNASDILYSSKSEDATEADATVDIQTNELDFIFEIAEAPIVKAQQKNQDKVMDVEEDASGELTERDIQNVWHQAAKLFE